MMQPKQRIKRCIRNHTHMAPSAGYPMHGIMHALDTAINPRLALVPLIVAEGAVTVVGGDEVED